MVGFVRRSVYHERLITGVAVALAGSAVVLAVLAVVYNPAILVISAALGAASYLMWYQASGRLAARVYRSVEQQATEGGGGRSRSRTRTRTDRGGFGAGPREEWSAPGGRGGRGGGSAGGQQQRQRRRRAPSASKGPSEAEAYRLLGLEPGADKRRVKEAYRERVKEVHPDANGGDEEAFKRVNRAYERLT